MHSKQFLSDAWPCVMWPHTASAAGWQAQISDGVDRWIPSFACGPAHTVAAACRHRPLLHQQTHVHHTQSQILTSDQSPRPLAASPGNTQANADDAHHTGSRHHLMQSIVAPTPGHSTSPACQYQHEQAKKGSMGAPAAASARHTRLQMPALCQCARQQDRLSSICSKLAGSSSLAQLGVVVPWSRSSATMQGQVKATPTNSLCSHHLRLWQLHYLGRARQTVHSADGMMQAAGATASRTARPHLRAAISSSSLQIVACARICAGICMCGYMYMTASRPRAKRRQPSC